MVGHMALWVAHMEVWVDMDLGMDILGPMEASQEGMGVQDSVDMAILELMVAMEAGAQCLSQICQGLMTQCFKM